MPIEKIPMAKIPTEKIPAANIPTEKIPVDRTPVGQPFASLSNRLVHDERVTHVAGVDTLGHCEMLTQR